MEAIYSLNDVRNNRGSYLSVIIPRTTIRKVYIPQKMVAVHEGTSEGSSTTRTHSVRECFTNGLAGKIARELQKQRGEDCDFELDGKKARLLRDLSPTYKESTDFIKIFKMYYGPFFRLPEYDIPEIASSLKTNENEIYHQLLDLDTEFFIPSNPIKTDYMGPLRRFSDTGSA